MAAADTTGYRPGVIAFWDYERDRGQVTFDTGESVSVLGEVDEFKLHSTPCVGLRVECRVDTLPTGQKIARVRTRAA